MDQEILEIINSEDGLRNSSIRMNEQMLNIILTLCDNNYNRGEAVKLKEELERDQEGFYILSQYNKYLLTHILDRILSDNNYKLKDGIVEEFEYETGVLKEYREKYNDILKKYRELKNRIDSEGDKEDSEIIRSLYSDQNLMSDFIKVSSQLKEATKNACRARDLTHAKSETTTNLRYFLSDDKIKELEARYEEALSESDFTNAKSILEEAQQLILEHWKTYTTDIDSFKQGDKFRFICHTTNFTQYDKPFRSRIVSASLFTENLTETFNSGFGFILGPDNIIGANSSDMYVNNYAENNEEMLSYSTVKKIDPPERLIKECLELKEENKKSNNTKKVYNEVVIDGFKPIALFCFTNGSKNLNNNYRNVHELQAYFPELKIVEIDLTDYKKDEELFEEKKELILNIRRKLASLDPKFTSYSDSYRWDKLNIEDDRVLAYNLFWNQFLELKKSKEYNEDDIIKLYKRNDELVTTCWVEEDFIKNCSEIELDTMLKNNYVVGINGLFGDKGVKTFRLDRLYENLYKYKDDKRLDNSVPGLTTFLEVYKKVPLSEECIDSFKECESFIEINEIIINYINLYQNTHKDKAEKLEEEISKYIRNIEEYEQEINNKELLVAEYEKSRSVVDCEYIYSRASFDIRNIAYKKEIEKSSRNIYEKEEIRLKERLKEIESNLTKLNKHPLLNKKAINVFLSEQHQLNESLKSTQCSKKESIELLKIIEREVEDIRKDFKEKTNIDYLVFEDRLQEAKDTMDRIDIVSLKSDIMRLTMELDSIKEKLIKTQDKLAQENKETNIVPREEIESLLENNKPRQKGYIKVWILAILSTLVNLGILILGIYLR